MSDFLGQVLSAGGIDFGLHSQNYNTNA